MRPVFNNRWNLGSSCAGAPYSRGLAGSSLGDCTGDPTAAFEFHDSNAASFSQSLKRPYKIALAAIIVSLGLTTTGCSQQSSADPSGDMAVAMKLRKELTRGGSVGAEEEAGQEQATGWSTLKGQFVLDGAAPPPVQLDVKADREVCAPGDRPVLEYPVIVDEGTKGIANIVIFARKVAAEHTHPDMAPGKTDEVVFDQENCVFKSPLLVMQTSQTVKVLNSDPVAHNISITSVSFNNTVPVKSSIEFKAPTEAAAPFDARCSIHPWMLAYILPRDNSYFAVTGADGSFEIPNLPAGISLEFQVWQQKSKALQRVSVDGAATTWKSGRFTLKLEEGQPTELKVTVPAAAFQ